jgi:hypothetical protein
MIPWAHIAAWLEMAGGSKALPAAFGKSRRAGIARGVWWVLLFALALAFAGRHTKFVYVDSIVTALAGLVALDGVFAVYGSRHFMPNTTLAAAEASGESCVVTLGDSRMAAGIDPTSLADTLRDRGAPRCVAALGIGAVGISGSAMAMRRLLADNRKPELVVLGESAGSLLPDDPPDPSAFFGNRAVELEWSVPADVATYYPQFPFGQLDRGIRFSLARTNAIQTYESLVWFKVKALQERIVSGDRGGKIESRNRFGLDSDMRALLASFGSNAVTSLQAFDGRWRSSPWFNMLQSLVRQAHARLVVVEMPMASSYRAEVLDREDAVRYRTWLRAELEHSGDVYLDLSPSSVRDEDFADGLHLNESGARRFSAALGEALAPILATRRQ